MEGRQATQLHAQATVPTQPPLNQTHLVCSPFPHQPHPTHPELAGVNSGRLTYDGIDVLGDRLACLVRSFCARLATGGLRRVTRISFVAYR